MMQKKTEWIQTFTGGKFWPLAPRKEDVKIADIAHALSNVCRFTGHVLKFYSVAEHSVRVSYVAEQVHRRALFSEGIAEPVLDTLNVLARWGLMHDASEAYLCDVAAPVKRSAQFLNYRIAEKNLQNVIALACGLPLEMPTEVIEADLIMLATEAEALLPGGPHPDWQLTHKPDTAQIAGLGWDPGYAERAFLDRFAALGAK